MSSLWLLLASHCFTRVFASEKQRTVLLAGATGRTGILAYAELKKLPEVSVRALVRNVTKAKAKLGCNSCNESEGIYVGDITKPETLTAFTQGADVLVSTIGADELECKHGMFDCSYRNGSYPKDINWMGSRALTSAFAKAGGRQVVHMSTMSTTKPDNFLDKLGKGWVSFYSLNYEAYLMGAGLNFTIVKPCGLGDGKGGKREFLVGHEDDMNLLVNHMIDRADVARILAAAVEAPELAANLRFDLCTKALSEPTVSPQQVFQKAMRPWDPRRLASPQMSSIII